MHKMASMVMALQWTIDRLHREQDADVIDVIAAQCLMLARQCLSQPNPEKALESVKTSLDKAFAFVKESRR